MNKVTAHLISKLVIYAVIAAALCVGGYILYKEAFSKDGLKIDDTANVVEKISKIGEFTSVTYYEEQVLKNDKLTSFARSSFGKYVNSDSKNELVMIAKGHVRAGFDLKKLAAENIAVVEDSISIRLPETEIFDIIMNPSDFEVYLEQGDWSHEEIQKILHEAKLQLEKNALNENILEKAEASGVKKLTNLLKTFGFRAVNLEVAEQ